MKNKQQAWILTIILIVAILLLIWRFRQSSAQNQDVLELIKNTADREVISLSLGKCVFQTEVVKNSASIQQGLSGRPELASQSAMLFVMPTSERHNFWMPAMNFDLDIIWLQNGRVIDISANVPHPDPAVPMHELPLYAPLAPANQVLEINAAQAAQCQIVVGSVLE